MAKKVNVLILCGGPSNERAVSLKTGAQIAKALPKNKYRASLVEITKDGKWFLQDAAKKQLGKSRTTSNALVPAGNDPRFRVFEVAFIGMHGKFGEDGRVQALLEIAGIPYTGSGVLASALGMNKLKTLEMVGRHGVKTPRFLSLQRPPKTHEIKALIKKIEKEVGFPCVVKPNESGSSIGISIVRKKEDLIRALRNAFNEDATVLIEQYIKGTELTCAVMGNTGQTELTALPPVEIIPEGEFFDYHAKYFSKVTREICPARIGEHATKKLQALAVKAHAALGCDGVSRSDFIMTPKKEFYFLEVNTIPGLTESSLSPKEAAAAGMNFAEFLDRQVELALLKKK